MRTCPPPEPSAPAPAPITTDPPAPLSLAPAPIEMAPAWPAPEQPVDTDTAPEPALLVAPLCMHTPPLCPPATVDDEPISTEPPMPLATCTSPPD